MDFYQTTLDQAVAGIQTGAFSYQGMLERTISRLTSSGVRWIDYDSGHHNRIDVAARRAVMTGFRQVQGMINEQTAAALGTDTYEVTYHVGARPSHQPWQGRVWTMAQLRSVCGLGTVTGLHGANCYHDYDAFIPGVSERVYTDEQLEEMIQRENTPKTYMAGSTHLRSPSAAAGNGNGHEKNPTGYPAAGRRGKRRRSPYPSESQISGPAANLSRFLR